MICGPQSPRPGPHLSKQIARMARSRKATANTLDIFMSWELAGQFGGAYSRFHSNIYMNVIQAAKEWEARDIC